MNHLLLWTSDKDWLSRLIPLYTEYFPITKVHLMDKINLKVIDINRFFTVISSSADCNFYEAIKT